jgi:hypothetical protein
MRIIPVFMIALLTGCSGHFSAEELAGNYALSVEGGTDTIELNSNGTYTHSYKTKSGLVDHQVEAWTLEDLQAGPTVVLNNFRPLLEENIQGKGTYLLLVKRSFGHLHLITNIDLGTGYERQS